MAIDNVPPMHVPILGIEQRLETEELKGKWSPGEPYKTPAATPPGHPELDKAFLVKHPDFFAGATQSEPKNPHHTVHTVPYNTAVLTARDRLGPDPDSTIDDVAIRPTI